MTPLPPRIELALGYLGGTEANRIREYIADLEQQLRTLQSIDNQARLETNTLRANLDFLLALADARSQEIDRLNKAIYNRNL